MHNFHTQKIIINDLLVCVGEWGSKAVNKKYKGISKEGNFAKRTYLTNKKFEMLPLVKMPRAPTWPRIKNERSTMHSPGRQR